MHLISAEIDFYNLKNASFHLRKVVELIFQSFKTRTASGIEVRGRRLSLRLVEEDECRKLNILGAVLGSIIRTSVEGVNAGTNTSALNEFQMVASGCSSLVNTKMYSESDAWKKTFSPSKKCMNIEVRKAIPADPARSRHDDISRQEELEAHFRFQTVKPATCHATLLTAANVALLVEGEQPHFEHTVLVPVFFSQRRRN